MTAELLTALSLFCRAEPAANVCRNTESGRDDSMICTVWVEDRGNEQHCQRFMIDCIGADRSLDSCIREIRGNK